MFAICISIHERRSEFDAATANLQDNLPHNSSFQGFLSNESSKIAIQDCCALLDVSRCIRLKSFHYPAGRAVGAAAAIMRAIADGGTAAAAPMREAALTQGSLLHHLYIAVSSHVSPGLAELLAPG